MLKANIISGLIPAVLAPILWPFVVLLSEGNFPSWETYPTAALIITSFAFLIGLCACLALGFPALLILKKYNLNEPTVASGVGLVLAVALFFIIGVGGKDAVLSQTWPILMFFAVLGAACGATASILSRSNKSLKERDREKRAAP